MGMSYRRAWLLVDAMNRCWREPLVETSPGSAHGGGARLTAFGETVLRRFRSLQAAVDDAAQCGDSLALREDILPAPRKSQKG
jgi:molybdate transport system regulatory protein